MNFSATPYMQKSLLSIINYQSQKFIFSLIFVAHLAIIYDKHTPISVPNITYIWDKKLLTTY
jgi:hypothetical protein